MRLVPILAVLAVTGPGLCAQTPADAAWELTLRLSQVKRQMRTALENQPDYTCLATFDRYRWMIDEPAERKVDTVRVEVAFVGGHELYSWPGEGKFSEVPLSQMVGVGLVSDGDFAVHAHNVFVGDNAVEKYLGDETENGRKLWRWGYQISVYRAAWTIAQASQKQAVGIAGSFWVDAETHDVVRMDSHATDFLPGFPLKEAVSTVEYARVHIGERDVLLPVHGELKTVNQRGDENRNQTEYSNCRQYAGQSTISFGAPPPTVEPAPVKAKAAETQLPSGLTLHIRLSQDLHLAGAVVGDAVEGTLSEPLREGGNEIAPKGAAVHGRLRLLRQHAFGGQNYIEAGIAFEALDYPGHLDHFTAELRGFDSVVPGMSMSLVARQVAGENLQRQEQSTPTVLPGAGVFFFEAHRKSVPKGTLMTWRTE